MSPTPAVATGAPAPEPSFPKHRFDELNARYDQQQKQMDRLMGVLQAIAPLAKQAAPPAPLEPVDPKRQALIDELRGLIPFWDSAESLAAKKDQIEAAIQRIEQIAARFDGMVKDETARYDTYAKQTVAAVQAAIAPLLLPAGKTVADLSDFKKQTIIDLFVRWIDSDKTGGLAERYNASDQGLKDEFVTFFRSELVDPFKRDLPAADTRHARKVGALPVGGQTSSTLGTPPPKPQPVEGEDPLDAAAKRGWAMAQDLLRQP